MALARNLALRNLQQRFSTFMCPSGEKCLVGNRHSQSKLNRFMASSSGEQEEKESKEVSVSEKKSPRRIFPRRRGRKSLWRNTDDQDYFAPALNGMIVVFM